MVQQQPWSATRWVVTLVLVVAVQLGLLGWLSARSPLVAREPKKEPVLMVPDSLAGEMSALGDPTLFALANPRGFSGRAWMQEPSRPVENPDWSEQPHWLPMDTESLGGAFEHYAERHREPVHRLAIKPEPSMRHEAESARASRLPDTSTLAVEGALSGRRLLTALELPSWPHGDVLLPSIVQVVVDGRGIVLSAALLSGSGLGEADDHALKQAQRARFVRAGQGAGSADEVTVGNLVFRWHTVPPLETSPTPGGP